MRTLLCFAVLLAVLAAQADARYRYVRQAEEEEAPKAEVEAPAAEEGSGLDESVAADQPANEIKLEENEKEEVAVDPVPEPEHKPIETIKDENLDKCQKCLKPTFKHKHRNFCKKCFNLKVIDPKEAEELIDAIQCKKCQKPKYKARHGEFCSKECIIEVFEDKEKPAKEDMKDMDVEEDEDMQSAGGKNKDEEEEEKDMDEEMTEDADEDVIEEYEIMEENEEMKDKPKKKKHQHHHHEHKKHVKKNEKKKKIKFATSNMVETETVEEQEEVVDTKAVVAEVEVDATKPKLGFLGEIFKAIVKHNTWRSA